MLQIIAGIIGFFIALAAIGILLSLRSSSANWGSVIAGAVAIVAAAFIIIIIAIIYIIFALIGLWKFYQGRNEFGPAHARNFMMAIIFLILGIVLPNASGSFTPSYGLGTSPTDYYNQIRTSVIASGVMEIIGALMIALALTFFVKAFTAEEASKFKTGTILLMVGPIIGIVAVLAILPAKPGTTSLSDLATMASVSSSALSLGYIVSIIGYYFFYQGYKSLLKKMESGAIRPAPMSLPMPVPGYVPPPMPPQPYQAPPQYPPQQYPPQQYPPQQYPPQQYPPQQYPPQQPPQYPPPQY